MRVYVASSWRNHFQAQAVEQLRTAGRASAHEAAVMADGAAYYRPCPACGMSTHVRTDGRWRRHHRPDGELCGESGQPAGEDR